MDAARAETIVEAAWENRADVTPQTGGETREAVEAALGLLDSGSARVAEKSGDDWVVNQWLKKAVLLSFRLNDMSVIPGGPGGSDVVGQGTLQVRGLGRRRVPGRPASAPFPTAWCAAPPSSPRASC